MMEAEIITIGTEIILGHILDTNSSYISRRLASLGIDLFYHTSVGDNPRRIQGVLKTALKRSSLLIITGGLGPTTDDLTREMVASLLNLPLVLHQPSLQEIQERFRRFGRTMTKNNRKQAYLPKGAIPIPNEWGTAPGFILEREDSTIISVPGVPKEMKGMMEESVLPYLKKKVTPYSLYSRVLKVYGLGESSLEEKIKDLIEGQTNPTIALLAHNYQVKIHLIMKAKDREEAQQSLQFLEDSIRERIGDHLYSNKGESLETVVMGLLRERGHSLALAESITGGLVTHLLTNVPGASLNLKGSFIPYTKGAKGLMVTGENLLEGTVSPLVTKALAHRAKEITSSSIGAAITGLAGPGQGEEDRPIGLVFVALALDGKEVVKEALFHGGREEIKERAALFLLDQLRRLLMYEGK